MAAGKFLFLCLVSLTLVSSLDNGVGVYPPLGYNTWNDYRCNLTEQNVLNVIQAMVQLNKQVNGSVKYEYVNIDDCWAVSRLSNGTVVADPQKFPRGIAYLAQVAHQNGLKLGIYTDRGTSTCAGRPGSQGYEKIDASTYASWGVDYLKEDSCFATQDHQQAFAQYGLMRDALNATGRPILFSLCGWNSWYAPVGASLGNVWRIQGDVNSWEDALKAADTNAPLFLYAHCGAFNDPDMLLGSGVGSAVRLSPLQSRAQFSLWSIMSAPLLLGANVAHLNAWDTVTYTNEEVLQVQHDPSCRQGRRVQGGNLYGLSGDWQNVWAKPLADQKSWAVFFLNNHLTKTADVTCDTPCMLRVMNNATQWPSGKKIQIRDLWQHKVVGQTTSSFTATALPPNGGSALYKFTLI